MIFSKTELTYRMVFLFSEATSSFISNVELLSLLAEE